MKAYHLLLSFIGIVPATVSLLPPVGHQYYVIKTKATWSVAQNYCRETYDDLATVESDLDWLLLKGIVAREGLTDLAWVGLYIDSWYWSFNNVPMTYSNWGAPPGEKLIGTEECCETGPLGVWWEFSCERLFTFICYNANNSYANRYVGVSFKSDWKGALAYCRQFHTDLAFAKTATDNSAIQSIAASLGGSWLGGFRDPWKWSDETNTSNLQWLPGQPDNYYGSEKCAVLDQGMFSDTKCTGLNYFICHTTHQVRKKQFIKLEMKSDLSVIGPDVQSAVLELVKQKLDEYGMLMNTTVTWRVQADGQIFHKKKNTLPELDLRCVRGNG